MVVIRIRATEYLFLSVRVFSKQAALPTFCCLPSSLILSLLDELETSEFEAGWSDRENSSDTTFQTRKQVSTIPASSIICLSREKAIFSLLFYSNYSWPSTSVDSASTSKPPKINNKNVCTEHIWTCFLVVIPQEIHCNNQLYRVCIELPR